MSGRPTVGGLFAGYGGIELALHDVLDAEPAWFSEFDKAPSAILAHRFPGVPNHGDITAIDWSQVEPVDIITGGSPCQDLSHAGKRMGMKPGTRSGLWASMLTAVSTLRPSLVIWENVRGALSAEATSELEPCTGCVGGDDDGPVLRALGRVLGDLAGIGYDAAWTGLRAADVGAPHGRFRVFVLAWPAADAGSGGLERWPDLQGAGRSAALGGKASDHSGDRAAPPAWGSREWRDLTLMPTPTVSDTNGAGAHGAGGLDLRTAVSLLPTPRATDGTKGGPNQRGSSGDLMPPSAVQALLPTPRATRGGSGTETMYGLGGERSDDERPQGQILMPTPKAMDWKVTGQASPGVHRHVAAGFGTLPETLAVADFGQCAPAIARWEAVTRPAPAPTEPTGKAGAHRLSPRFVEWMQGLPDGWVTGVPGVSRNDQLKALGNGVVPQQLRAAVRHLLTIRETALRMTKAVA